MFAFAAEAAPTSFVRRFSKRCAGWWTIAVVLLADCAQLPSSPIDSGDSPVAACRALFSAMDAEVRRAGVADAGAHLSRAFRSCASPARAARGSFDPCAGELDAVTWRVTLTDAGEVLAHDSIHACGCYYSLFPGPGREAKTDFPPSEEPVFAPLPAPRTRPGEAVRIHLEADRHYLFGLETVAREKVAVDQELRPVPTDRLRSLPVPEGGRASLYAPSGLVPASARPERFLLWPLGVPSAGAMRQDGHHAIAFIGRRHFDDPFLLESLLERRPD